ncbi:hypothetical protein BJ742DRAFT_856832 [Cladochytrium replicatum]|nr:hypothetical protein BJ742DRAFT_856832 [Cladochytrium replicatum]
MCRSVHRSVKMLVTVILKRGYISTGSSARSDFEILTTTRAGELHDLACNARALVWPTWCWAIYFGNWFLEDDQLLAPFCWESKSSDNQNFVLFVLTHTQNSTLGKSPKAYWSFYGIETFRVKVPPRNIEVLDCEIWSHLPNEIEQNILFRAFEKKLTVFAALRMPSALYLSAWARSNEYHRIEFNTEQQEKDATTKKSDIQTWIFDCRLSLCSSPLWNVGAKCMSFPQHN